MPLTMCRLNARLWANSFFNYYKPDTVEPLILASSTPDSNSNINGNGHKPKGYGSIPSPSPETSGSQALESLVAELNFHVLKFHFRRVQASRNIAARVRKKTGQTATTIATHYSATTNDAAVPAGPGLIVPTLEDAYKALLRPIKRHKLCEREPDWAGFVEVLETVVEETDYPVLGLRTERMSWRDLWGKFRDWRTLDKDLYRALYGRLVVGKKQ